MQISSPIIPAIIPKSYTDLGSQIETIKGLPEVHIDVVDGVFVPGVSWPYNEDGDVSSAHDLLAPFSLEVDLMVEKPLPAAYAWLASGADQLVFHLETITVDAFAQFTIDCPVSVGIACNNDTPLSALYEYLPHADYVQCMGIAAIGSQGQPFDELVIERIVQIHKDHPKIPLAIDGGVSAATLPRLIKLGLSRFIVGSAIMKTENPKVAYTNLTKISQS